MEIHYILINLKKEKLPSSVILAKGMKSCDDSQQCQARQSKA